MCRLNETDLRKTCARPACACLRSPKENSDTCACAKPAYRVRKTGRGRAGGWGCAKARTPHTARKPRCHFEEPAGPCQPHAHTRRKCFR